MAANKSKTDTEAQALRVAIAARYVKGETQASIAVALSLSQQAVSYHLTKIEAEWARQYAAQIDAAKWAQLARIDELERTYWLAWAESREAINRQTQTGEITDPAKPARPSRVVQVTEERSGDPRWLAGVQWCIETRCKILGLYAPQKVAPTDPTGAREWQPDQRLQALNDAQLAALEVLIAQMEAPPDVVH